ncbi:MAG TPA: 3-deoxy-7-phosphoheptulonate synthase, partial [Clostridiaceae bacterium]|nr:3-deoxy-7-phosphoheptulonate synthase [Clostridiaceae bacterium]
MIIIMKPEVHRSDVDNIVGILERHELVPHISEGAFRTIIGVVGDKTKLDTDYLILQPGVERLVPIISPYKLAGRTFKPESSVFSVGDVEFGGQTPVQIAGPCAVESYEQIFEVAEVISSCGAQVLRGGAYKPRTSPYSFQGLGVDGLKMMREAADAFGLLVISEITSEYDLDEAAKYIDIVQVGARNAQNFRLLAAIGKIKLPVMLKRGMALSIDEWLGSAEYILSEGEYRVMLCERGIRTFETAYRSTLDIGAIPVLKEKTHLPIFVDPSHAAGRAALVPPLARAAIAAGADGLIIEVHPNPSQAKSDA